MAPDHDPDDERTPSGPPLPPEDRLWRHPSELGRSASQSAHLVPVGAGAAEMGVSRRTSTRGILAGACLAGALVAFGALMLSRPMPGEDLRRGGLARGTTVSISTSATSVLAPVAIAANPILRTQAVPLGNAATSGRLGIEVADERAGAVVVTTEAGGPAQRAGMRVGDVVQRVDRTVVDSAPDLLEALEPTRPGQTVTVTIRRGTETSAVPIVLG